MKRKLLFAALCAVGALGMRAQEDVTSTYLKNAGFEGKHSSYSKPSSDRDIFQPEGWSISYTNDNSNDLTSLNSETTQWSQFSKKPQPTNGGSKAYWMRFRWGSSENITLSQETSANLPAGTYAVSVDAYSDDNTGTATISVAGVSQTVRTNGTWANYKVVFTLTEAQKVTVSLSYTNTAADDHAAAFDNVKILDLTSEPTGITLKNDLGGTAADLSDFNVWYNDYTLEVEGTAGTAISVAADNISYTPEATGTVRFVKKDGIVYVYEETSYKTAVHSSKAAYVYSNTLSQDDPNTNNYLENPSFETTGDLISGKKYKIGGPWKSNYSGSDIRIDKGTKSGIHGECVLVWRGSGSGKDWYISQKLTSSIPLYKGVKVFLQQIDGGNANAQFNVGIGNAEGGYGYLSTQMNLGSGKNGTYNYELGYAEGMATGDVYFTFRNTSTNTSSSGNDPVTQIDWMGLVSSDDFPISGVSSASYVYGTAYAPATAKSSYLAAKAAAEATIEDNAYEVVTGQERTDLQNLIDADVEDNDAAYNTAATNLQNATNALIDAASHYQALKDARDAVPDLAYASASAAEFKTAEATSASDADAKLAAITPAVIRAYYESHALAEGVDGAVDKTSLLTNYNNPSNTNGWTKQNTSGDCKMRTMSTESYTDADGTNNHSYFDSDSWGAAFSSTFTQNVELPAGTYILTAKARGNGTTKYQVVADGQTTNIEAIGNTGGVFGRGWNDYTVKFTVATKKTVTLGINMETGNSSNWLSFGDFRLVRIDFEDATETEYNALAAAIAAKDGNTLGKTLGFEAGEYAPYNNVEVLTALANAKAVDPNGENAKADIVAFTAALQAAQWSSEANDRDVDAIFNGMFDSTVEGDWGLTGWTRTNGWGQQRTKIEGKYATAYYNQPGSLQYGNQGVYTMPLKANTWYKLTFAYRSHENNSNNGMTVSILNGEEGLAATNFEENNSTSDWAIKEHIFQTVTAGNYVLTLANSGNTWITGVSITKSTQSSATMSVKASKWGTFVAPFDVTIPAGIRAYKVTGVEEGYMVKTEVKTTIPANTPVVLKNETEGNITETFSGDGLPESENCTFGLLTGLYYQKTDIPAGSYVLQTQDGVQAFYQVESTMSDKGVANRCYLTLPVNANKRNALFFDKEEGTTGLEAPAATNADDGILYNVAGQQVNASYKGLIIKNRRVMLNK